VFNQAGDQAMKRLALAFLVVVGAYGTFDAAQAQSSCKVCADQQKACMKNYGGPACKTEDQKCMKSFGEKEESGRPQREDKSAGHPACRGDGQLVRGRLGVRRKSSKAFRRADPSPVRREAAHRRGPLSLRL